MSHAEEVATDREKALVDVLKDTEGISAHLVSTGGNSTAVVYEVSEDYQVVYTDTDVPGGMLGVYARDAEGEMHDWVSGSVRMRQSAETRFFDDDISAEVIAKLVACWDSML